MSDIYKQMEKDELEHLDKFIKLNTTTVIRKKDGLYCSECDGDLFSQLPFCENCDAEKTGKCNNSDAGYCDGADCDICGKGFKEGDEILCLTDCDEDGEFAVHTHINCFREKIIKDIHERIHDEWVEREWIQK